MGWDETKTPSTTGSIFRLAQPQLRKFTTLRFRKYRKACTTTTFTTTPLPHPHTHTYTLNTAVMTGVSVRDVPADKFINAYAAFLKRQGKLPIPGS